MTSFSDLGPFREGLGYRELGAEAHRLTKAMTSVPAASEAARALGDPQLRTRRILALTLLDALPQADKDRIRRSYEAQVRRAHLKSVE